MQIFVKAAKGKKDRYTVLSEKVLATLREYYRAFKPDDWLFEGQAGGKYSGIATRFGAEIKQPILSFDF